MKAKTKKKDRDISNMSPIDMLPGDFDLLIEGKKALGIFSYWVSNLSHDDLQLLAKCLPREKYTLEIRTLDSPKVLITNPKIFPIYDVDNERYSAAIGEVRPVLQGRYLRILIGTEATDQYEDTLDFLFRTVHRIRMTYGISAATEEVQRVRRDVVKDQYSMTDEIGIWGPLVKNDLSNARDLTSLDWREIKELSTEPWIISALETAISSRSNETRFVFLWIVLEGILGDGKKRQQFFLNELGSSELNDEAFRLFKIRNEVFHNGKLNVGVPEVMRVLEFIRIAMLPKCALRNDLVQELAKRVRATAS